jgi:dTDP-4-dehydrorhamnose 3,5-epimerase
VSNSGDPVSWAGWTREIFAEAGYKTGVDNITNDEYYSDKPRSATRPLSSTLSLDKIEATGFEPHDWREDLKQYIKKELS